MENKPKTAHFGRKVRNSRETKGWTQAYVAELSDICDKTLEQIEMGDTNPKLSSVLNVATALDIDLGELNSCKPDKPDKPDDPNKKPDKSEVF